MCVTVPLSIFYCLDCIFCISFALSALSPTVHGVAAAQPAPIHLRLWLRGPSVSGHHAQCGSTHHADHQIHRILQEHLHPPWEQRLCYCGLFWRWTGVWMCVCMCVCLWMGICVCVCVCMCVVLLLVFIFFTLFFTCLLYNISKTGRKMFCSWWY